MSSRGLFCVALALVCGACAPSEEDPPRGSHTQQEAGARAERDAGVTGERDAGSDTKFDARGPTRGDAGPATPSSFQPDASPAAPGSFQPDANADALSSPHDAGNEPDGHVAGDASRLADQDAGTPNHTQPDPYLCGQPALGPNELLDVGHAHWVDALARAGNRVLSHDENKHWILWDASSRTRVASGDSTSVALAGKILVVTDNGTTEVRSVEDGARLASMRTDGTTGVSSDGAYIWSASRTRLTVWSANGSQRFRRAGNYERAQLHAGPTELRVALGAAGDDVIELISAVDGNASASRKYTGKFSSWFADGGRFLSRSETALHVYTKSGEEEQVVGELPVYSEEFAWWVRYAGGQGNYFWFTVDTDSAEESLRLYRIGQEQPLLTRPGEGSNAIVAGPGFMASLSPLRLYDLRGDTVQASEFAPENMPHITTFAIDSEGRWVLGTQHGVVFEKSDLASQAAPRTLSCGAVRSIAGSRSGRTAVAVASGTIFIHELASAGPRLRTALSDMSEKVQLSDDGNVLAAQSLLRDTSPSRRIKSIALPSGAEIHRWDYAESPFLLDFELSRDGSRIALQATGTFGFTLRSQRDVTSTDGATNYFSGVYDTRHDGLIGNLQFPFLLSTKGTFVAFPLSTVVELAPQVAFHAAAPTLVYRDGTLQGMADGQILGWLDDSRMVVHHADPPGAAQRTDPLAPAQGRQFIAGVDGQEIAPARIPRLDRGWTPLRAIDDRRIYAPSYNSVYDIVDGTTLWQRSTELTVIRGDIAAEHVVYGGGRKVMFEKY